MSIEGYNLVRKDRADNRRGGGVAFYIRSNISFTICEDLVEPNFSETLFCNVNCGKENTLIGVCYRPPNSTVENDRGLYSLLNKITGKSVIVGDFNLPELDWNKRELLSDSHPFVKCLNDNYLEQLVDKPTRGRNILDLVLTSDESLIQNLEVLEPFESSDHQMVKLEIIAKASKINQHRLNFNYFKANYEEIRNYIKGRNLELMVEGKEVEDAWNVLKKELLQVRDKFIPKRNKHKNKKKWVTKMVVKLRKDRVKAWNNYIKSGRDKLLFEIFKSKLRLCVKENNKAKRHFEERLANNIKNDSKSFFAYVKSKQRTKVAVGPLKDQMGEVIQDDKIAANKMNEYFASVFTVEDTSSIPDPIKFFNSDNELDKLVSLEISEDEVRIKLNNLNVNKSPGPDQIHAKLLYELREEIVGPVTKLFNFSLRRGIVPQEWKDAHVTPLHKKAVRLNVKITDQLV